MCLCCINGNGMAFEGCKRWVSRAADSYGGGKNAPRMFARYSTLSATVKVVFKVLAIYTCVHMPLLCCWNNFLMEETMYTAGHVLTHTHT